MSWWFIAAGVAFVAWQMRVEWRLLAVGDFGEGIGYQKDDGWTMEPHDEPRDDELARERKKWPVVMEEEE